MQMFMFPFRSSDNCASDIFPYGFGNWSKMHTYIRFNAQKKVNPINNLKMFLPFSFCYEYIIYG